MAKGGVSLFKLFKLLRENLIFLFNIKNFKHYWSQIVIVLVPVVLVLYPSLPRIISANHAWAIAFILIMAFCVIVSLNVPRDKLLKIEEINSLENKLSGLNSFLESTPERVIKSIFNYLNFGYEERITVYRFEDSHFVPIGRYSKNAHYKKSGRDRYPCGEGFIKISWNKGECIVEGLPDPDRQYKSYIREVKSKCDIDESTLENMEMKSRSYYCINLEDLNRDPIAVIVFESTGEKLPKETEEIKHLLDSSFGHLIVEVINMNIPPGRGDE